MGEELCRIIGVDTGMFSVIPRGDVEGKVTAVFCDGSYSPYWIPAEASPRAERRRRALTLPERLRQAWRIRGSLRDVA